jgi:hypothetical protein
MADAPGACNCEGCLVLDARYAFRLARGILKRHYADWTDRYKPRVFLWDGKAHFGVRTCPFMNVRVMYTYDARISSRSNAIAWVRDIHRIVDAPGMLPPGCTAEDWTLETHAFLCTSHLCAEVRVGLLCLQRRGVLCIAAQVVQHMVRHAELIERRRRSGEVADEEDGPFYDWRYFSDSADELFN